MKTLLLDAIPQPDGTLLCPAEARNLPNAQYKLLVIYEDSPAETIAPSVPPETLPESPRRKPPSATPEMIAERMAAFQRLRDSNAFASIADPVAWQREIRQDRPLPFRD